MKPLGMEAFVKVKNFQLHDLTNYPYSIDSNLQYEKIDPYELVGTDQKDKNLLELSFISYDEKNPKADLKNRIFSYVDIKLSSIKINYVQQPVLRLIDYMTGQLLSSLRPNNTNDTPEGPKYIVKVTREDALNIISNPQFMDIKIFIESPIITLKPLPTSVEYLEVRLGDISIENERCKNKDRHSNPSRPLEFVWTEVMRIKLNRMGFFKVLNSNKFELTKEFNFDLLFERLLFTDEYRAAYGFDEDQQHQQKFNLDDSMKLDGRMSPMIMIMVHEDYLLIMRCLFFNVTYDDLMDKLFVSNYQEVPPKIDMSEDSPSKIFI